MDKNGQVSVRPAMPNDAQAMQEIHHDCINQIFPGVYSETALKMWKRLLNLDNYIAKTSGWCYVAVIKEEIEEKVVGFACLNPDTTQFPPMEKDYKYDVQIESVYVSVNHHKLGIGRKLMQELERKALNEGRNRAGMLASMSALSFYEKVGYSIVEKKWYNVNPDKEEDRYSNSIYSIEARVMIKNLDNKLINGRLQS